MCDDLDSHTADVCVNPGTPQSFCTNTPITCLNNSECGTNAFTGAPFCNGNNVFQNFLTYTCNNPGTIQSSCSITSIPLSSQNCTAGQVCSNGACVPVACSSDSQCGTNGFVGGLFCTGNSVFQNYITFTCHSPGTPQSSCSSSTTSQLNQNCGANQICQNGACVCNTKNGKTFSLSDPFVIRDYVNKKAAALGLRTTTDAYNLDAATAKEICNLAGYYNVKSTGCVATNYQDRCGWFSCYDNLLSKWNPKTNNFENANACDRGNVWISSITCVNKMC